MKALRAYIVCHEIRWRVEAEEFRKNDYGWSKTEITEKLLKKLGIEVTDYRSVQVIPVDRHYWIVLREH